MTEKVKENKSVNALKEQINAQIGDGHHELNAQATSAYSDMPDKSYRIVIPRLGYFAIVLKSGDYFYKIELPIMTQQDTLAKKIFGGIRDAVKMGSGGRQADIEQALGELGYSKSFKSTAREIARPITTQAKAISSKIQTSLSGKDGKDSEKPEGGTKAPEHSQSNAGDVIEAEFEVLNTNTEPPKK